MWDYLSLSALDAVVRAGSFQAAARELHLTQSAVSQRIKSLEEQVGARLLDRTQPPTPTSLGELLVRHVRQVQRLEESLHLSLNEDLNSNFVTLTLGVNSDSLATWFFEAMGPLLKQQGILLDLIIENEGVTFSRLQRGEVVGCISTRAKRLAGCEVEKIGVMQYRLASTPEFAKQYFPDGVTAENVKKTPAVIFDLNDKLHDLFLLRFLRIRESEYPLHRINTSHGFLEVIRQGLAYGMAPVLQAQKAFDSGALVDLAPGKVWKQELYWHHQRREDEALRKLSKGFVSNARKILRKEG